MGRRLIFFHYPRACSLAVHIALEEAGLDWQRPAVRRVVEVERRDRNYPGPAHWGTP